MASMRRGQASITLFPVLMIILIAAWLLATMSIFNLLSESHKSITEINERHKTMMDANIYNSELPSPLVDNGTIQNTGVVPLTDMNAYRMTGTIDKVHVSDVLFQHGEADYPMPDTHYGDVLAFTSRESVWLTTVVPRITYSNAAMRIGTFSGENQAVITAYTASATRAEYPIGTPNALLKNALETMSDNATYSIPASNEFVLQWDPGVSCFPIGVQLGIYADNGLGTNENFEVYAWNGAAYQQVYTCVFPTGQSTCYTPNLSNTVMQDGTAFKFKFKPTPNSLTLDWVRIEARCTG